MNVRPCRPEDADAVLGLLAGPTPAAPAQRADFLRIYFDNPWLDPDLPSLVCETQAGIVGFLGVTPRPMRFAGRAVRASVTSNFRVSDAVDPRQRPFVAARLVRTYMSGAQELSLADGSTDTSRRIWEACGGLVAPLYSLDWLLPLRPATAALALGGVGRRQQSLMVRGALTAGRLADIALSPVAARLMPRPEGAATTAAVAADAVAGWLPDAVAAPMRPQTDAAALHWVLDVARRLAVDGSVRGLHVLDEKSQMLGWFYWVRRSADVAEVLQLVAARGDADRVLAAAIEEARRAGAALVRGHAEGNHFQAYRNLSCLLNTGRWMLVHARDPALAMPFRCGEAWFSALDGERWIGSFDGR